MLSVKKILVVAGLLGASLFGMSASAQAGGFGYGYGCYPSYHCAPVYRKVIIHTPYYTPVYNHCLPTYFGY